MSWKDSSSSQESSSAIHRQIQCRYYLKGRCRFGDICFNDHSTAVGKADQASRGCQDENWYMDDDDIDAYPDQADDSISGRDEPDRDERQTITMEGTPLNAYQCREMTSRLPVLKLVYPKKAAPATKTLPFNLYHLIEAKRSTVCVHYQRGYCIYGDRCYRIHPGREKQQQELAAAGTTQVKLNPKPEINVTTPEVTTDSTETKPVVQEGVYCLQGHSKKKRASKKRELKVLYDSLNTAEQNRKRDADGQHPVKDQTEDDDHQAEAVEAGPPKKLDQVVPVCEKPLTKREKKKQDLMMEKLVKKFNKKISMRCQIEEGLSKAFAFIQKENFEESLIILKTLWSAPQEQVQDLRFDMLLGRSHCHIGLIDAWAALANLRDALRYIKPGGTLPSTRTSSFEFYSTLAGLEIVTGNVDEAWKALDMLPKDNDRTKWLNGKLAMLDSSMRKGSCHMDTAYAMLHQPLEKIEEDWTSALRELQVASKLAPDSVKLKFMQAEVLVHLQRRDEALELVKPLKPEVVEEYRDYDDGLNGLLEYFTIDYAPFSNTKLNYLDKLFKRLGKIEPRWMSFRSRVRAILDLEKYLGMVCEKHGLETISTSLNLDPTNRKLTAMLHLVMGRTLLGKQTRKKVKNMDFKSLSKIFWHLDHAISLDKTYLWPRVEKARIYALLNDYDNACREFKHAEPIPPRQILDGSGYRKLRHWMKKRTNLIKARQLFDNISLEANPEEIDKALDDKLKEIQAKKIYDPVLVCNYTFSASTLIKASRHYSKKKGKEQEDEANNWTDFSECACSDCESSDNDLEDLDDNAKINFIQKKVKFYHCTIHDCDIRSCTCGSDWTVKSQGAQGRVNEGGSCQCGGATGGKAEPNAGGDVQPDVGCVKDVGIQPEADEGQYDADSEAD